MRGISLAMTALLLVGVAAAPLTSAIELTASITNLAPSISSMSLSGLTSGALSPTSGTTSSITASVLVLDANGCNDVSGVTIGIIKPDGSTVHLAQAAGAFSSCNGAGTLGTWTKSLAMNYYDAAALTTSTYKIVATATDTASATGSNLADLTLATFNYNQLVAMNAPSTFALSAAPGAAGSASSLSVNNYGNVQIDTQVSGTALTYSSSTIPVGSVAYSLSSDMSSSTALTGTAATISTFNLAASNGAAKTVYLQLTAPNALPVGSYTGTLTVTAVSG